MEYEELEQLRHNVNDLYFDIRKIEKEISSTLQFDKINKLVKLKEEKEQQHEEARLLYIDIENKYLEGVFFYGSYI